MLPKITVILAAALVFLMIMQQEQANAQLQLPSLSLPPTLGNMTGGEIPTLGNITREEAGNVTTTVHGPVTDYINNTGNRIVNVFYESPSLLILHWEQFDGRSEITNSAWPIIDHIHTHFGYNIDKFTWFINVPGGQNGMNTVIVSNAMSYDPAWIDATGNAKTLPPNGNLTITGNEQYVNSGWLVPKGGEQIFPGSSHTFTATFQKAGTYSYTCTLHPWMAGQVVVK